MISSLTELGFTDEQAQVALQMSEGNVQRAVHFLLEQASAAVAVPGPAARARKPAAPPDRGEDRALTAALEASRREAAAETKRRMESRQAEQAAEAAAGIKPASAPAPARPNPFSIARGASASAAAAAAAAERRFGSSSQPAPAAAKPRGGAAAAAAAMQRFATPVASTAEQKVQACAARLAGHAVAVDTLIVSLERAIASPNDERCRKVSLTHRCI